MLLVGGIGVVDLRVAGAFRSVPLAPLTRALTPLAIAGLTLQVLSGPILFAADARALAESSIFRWKLVLIATAIVNVWAFRRVRGDPEAPPPLPARILAVASLSLWLSVAALGRLIAYH